MLKKSVLLLLFIAAGFIGSTQTIHNSGLIIDFLGEEKYSQLLESNPSYIYYLDVRCTSGFQIIEYADEKMNQMPVLNVLAYKTPVTKENPGKVEITAEQFLSEYENGTLNILKYILDYHQKQVTYYVLGNTGKVLMLLPVEYINKQVNQNYK